MSSMRSFTTRSNGGGSSSITSNCSRCGVSDWDASGDGEPVCRFCATRGATVAGESRGSAGSSPLTVGAVAPAPTPVAGPSQPRKDMRPTVKKGGRPSKFKRQALAKASVPKGKGRRDIFKKIAVRAPLAVATPVTSNHLFHKGIYYQVGDIVSLVSLEGDVYYAQLRGLLQDQYCEKSGVISWLLPTAKSPPPEQGFDPSTYIIGPDEELPRRLDCMNLVCSAPSDYFKLRNAPYPTSGRHGNTGFVFTRLGPRAVPADRAKEFMV